MTKPKSPRPKTFLERYRTKKKYRQRVDMSIPSKIVGMNIPKKRTLKGYRDGYLEGYKLAQEVAVEVEKRAVAEDCLKMFREWIVEHRLDYVSWKDTISDFENKIKEKYLGDK